MLIGVNLAPVANAVEIKYKMVRYNGSFLHETIYRRDASPEVDLAWEALGVDYRPLRVSEADAKRSGITSDQAKIRKEHGGGYSANLEGLHHLHCLVICQYSRGTTDLMDSRIFSGKV